MATTTDTGGPELYGRKCMGCLREPPAGRRNLGRKCLRELVNGLRRRREAERRLPPLSDFYRGAS